MVDTQTVAELKAAVAATPLDADLRRVYADALEEAGEQKVAEVQRLQADRVALLSPWSRANVLANLAKTNGKRRTRTLDLDNVLWAVGEAARGGWAEGDGGGVANAYGYAAVTTLVLAVLKDDGTVAVDVGEAVARKGGGSPANAWPELVQWRPDTAKCQERIKAWAEAR